MKRLRNPVHWLGLLLFGLLTWQITDKVRNMRAQSRIEAFFKRYDDVLSKIRNENDEYGYKFEFYHGQPLLLMVEGPQTEAQAIEIEEGLIRQLKAAKFIPSKIMYTRPPGDPESVIAVRVVDLPPKN